jgi:hypothetical protein
MSRNANRAAARTRRKSRRTSTLLSLAAVAVVITLLALEQVALLYLISTVSVAGLLTVVALADLRGAKRDTLQPAPADDSAAIGDRTLKTTTPVAAPPARTGRPRQRSR